MQFDEALKLVVDKVPTEYPKHMLCYFAANAARGVVLPFRRRPEGDERG